VADTTSKLLNKVKNIMKTSKSVKVQNSAAPKTAATKFAWDEKNQAIISEAYAAQLLLDHSKANTTAFLATVAAKVGAKSGQAVRSKLSSMGEYNALDKAAVSISKPRVTKPLLADEIRAKLVAAGVELDEEAGNSLANSNASALKAVIAGLDLLTKVEPVERETTVKK
jgi:hypothetical protein